MNVENRGLSAVSGATWAPAAPETGSGTRREVPAQAPQTEVPGTAAALPVAESALRQVLASQGSPRGPDDAASMALDLLRSVEALLRATAPDGASSQDFGAAAARLVERQGLLARLTGAPGTPGGTWTEQAGDEDAGPASLDTRL